MTEWSGRNVTVPDPFSPLLSSPLLSSLSSVLLLYWLFIMIQRILGIYLLSIILSTITPVIVYLDHVVETSETSVTRRLTLLGNSHRVRTDTAIHYYIQRAWYSKVDLRYLWLDAPSVILSRSDAYFLKDSSPITTTDHHCWFTLINNFDSNNCMYLRFRM